MKPYQNKVSRSKFVTLPRNCRQLSHKSPPPWNAKTRFQVDVYLGLIRLKRIYISAIGYSLLTSFGRGNIEISHEVTPLILPWSLSSYPYFFVLVISETGWEAVLHFLPQLFPVVRGKGRVGGLLPWVFGEKYSLERVVHERNHLPRFSWNVVAGVNIFQRLWNCFIECSVRSRHLDLCLSRKRLRSTPGFIKGDVSIVYVSVPWFLRGMARTLRPHISAAIPKMARQPLPLPSLFFKVIHTCSARLILREWSFQLVGLSLSFMVTVIQHYPETLGFSGVY